MIPYAHLIEKLDAIPGIDKVLAMAIIAEATADMSSFPDERRFAAWAGVAPGNNESAGKKKIKMPTRKSSSQKSLDPGGQRGQAGQRVLLPIQISKIAIASGIGE